MTSYGLVLHGLRYYWRTNAAVVLGVATAVAVLSGALLVGDSVRGSLRDLVLLRLGATDRAVTSSGFFRDALARDLQQEAGFSASFEGICPLIMMQGFVTHQAGGRPVPGVPGVQVYGVDDRFWRFHRLTGPLARGPDERDALINRVLASDLGAEPGASLLVRVERPSAIPIESLHGRKDNLGRTLRLRVRAILPPADLGDFSLQPRQGDVRAVFVPLGRLQQDLDVSGRVNTLLVSDRRQDRQDRNDSQDRQAALEALIRRHFALEDVGLTIRNAASGALVVESAAGLLDDARARAAEEAATASAMRSHGVFTYLANAMTSE
jgi:hypothetical protein